MVLDSKILAIKQRFGISSPEDWANIRPSQILAIDGIGPVTLDMVRIWLASRELTLLDDGTPELWKQRLGESKIGAVMGEADIAESCPFTILIDSQEKQPFSFSDMTGDGGIPLLVKTQWKSLGTGRGDYSIEGLEGTCHLERKSRNDAHGTILGWGERRERFVRELENLAAMDCAAVVVECSFEELIATAPQFGKRTSVENSRTLFRQVLAWQQDYRLPWVFCGSRRMAELATFRILQRCWKKISQAEKAAESRPARDGKKTLDLLWQL